MTTDVRAVPAHEKAAGAVTAATGGMTPKEGIELIKSQDTDATRGVNPDETRREKHSARAMRDTAEKDRWVSVVGTCERFDSTADLWHVGVRGRGTSEVLAVLPVKGDALTLDDVDAAMLGLGLVRSSAWEMGSDRGWVAWVTEVEGVTL